MAICFSITIPQNWQGWHLLGVINLKLHFCLIPISSETKLGVFELPFVSQSVGHTFVIQLHSIRQDKKILSFTVTRSTQAPNPWLKKFSDTFWVKQSYREFKWHSTMATHVPLKENVVHIWTILGQLPHYYHSKHSSFKLLSKLSMKYEI